MELKWDEDVNQEGRAIGKVALKWKVGTMDNVTHRNGPQNYHVPKDFPETKTILAL